MKIKKILIMLPVLAVVLSSAYMIGVKCGKQDAYSEVSIETKSTGYKYGVISSLAKEEGNRLFSAVEWFKAENIPKHNIVAFGKISFPNSNFEDYEEQEKKPYIILGYVIDADGKVYCGDYSDKECGYEVNHALLSRENVQCVGDLDEELLGRIMAVTSDWNNYGVAIEKDYDYTGCDFRICIVKHNEESVVEGITLYEAEKSYYEEDKLWVTHNANSVLNDIGRDLFDYFAKIYSDKAEKDYNYIIESEIR